MNALTILSTIRKQIKDINEPVPPDMVVSLIDNTISVLEANQRAIDEQAKLILALQIKYHDTTDKTI